MKTPPGAKPDEYEMTYNLKNKKTGEKKIMTDKEYMKTNIWKDNDWVIEGTPDRRLVKLGFTPKIRDLVILVVFVFVFSFVFFGFLFFFLVVVANNLAETDDQAIERLNATAINLAQNFNTRTVMLTSNSHQYAEAYAKQHKLAFEIFYADGVPLKTMVRANPGILLLKNGTVLGKWHYHSMPKYDDLV